MATLTEQRFRWSIATGIAVVAGLLAAGLTAFDLSGGQGLFIFFLYSIPCEFLVSLAPHDPAVLYLAIHHAPSAVALVGGAGTLVAESINYELLRRASASPTVARLAGGRAISRLAASFARAPFTTLWIAGFIPTIPFSALRLFILVREYPRGRYLLAAVSSRTLRFYLVALLGYTLRPSPELIAILFVALVLAVTLPGVYVMLAGRRPRVIAVIPARLGSSRFPGKPLAPLLGRSMLEHVVRRAELCESLDGVYVATCDAEIEAAVEGFGGRVLMTSNSHERASDRVAEAAQSLDADVVVMVQGDEPMITPDMISAAIAPMMKDSSVKCVNLVHRIADSAEIDDRNTIKVVMDMNRDALNFTRSPIPTTDLSSGDATAFYKQVCVIAFRRAFLADLASLSQTPLERAESIDMLRAIEHGRRVRLVETTVETHSVDTPADLRLVESRMALDPLLSRYRDSNGRDSVKA